MKLSNNNPEELNKTSQQKIVLFDIDYTLFDTDEFRNSNLTEFRLYKEVVPVLEEVGKVAAIGIFSEGQFDLQQLKLINTNILQKCIQEHIYIVANKEEELERVLQTYINHTVFLIDDKLTILYKAKGVLPHLYTIWVKRGKYAENQEPIDGFSPDSAVENLQEVIEIIKNK